MARNLPLEHQAAVDEEKTVYPDPTWQRRPKKFFFPSLGLSVEAETLEEATEKAKELTK